MASDTLATDDNVAKVADEVAGYLRVMRGIDVFDGGKTGGSTAPIIGLLQAVRRGLEKVEPSGCISLENHVDCCYEASRQQYLQGERDMLAKVVRTLRRERDEHLRRARVFSASPSSAIYVDGADNARTYAVWLARELKPTKSGGQVMIADNARYGRGQHG